MKVVEPEFTYTQYGLLLVNHVKILLLTGSGRVIDFSVSFCHFSRAHTFSVKALSVDHTVSEWIKGTKNR